MGLCTRRDVTSDRQRVDAGSHGNGQLPVVSYRNSQMRERYR